MLELIRNSFNDKSWNICYKACTILLNSIATEKIRLNDNELSAFIYYFEEVKKHI